MQDIQQKSVLIIGVTGETGTRLAKILVANGTQVIGLHRKAGQAKSLADMGIQPALADLVTITPEELAEAARSCGAIVFTAGASGGGDAMTDAIDGEGVRKAIAAAKIAGIKRLILVSAFPDAWRERRMPPDFEHYMFVKRQADVALSATDLDWVILRPGTLLNTPDTGQVRTDVAIPYGDVSRDDVAGVIAELLFRPDVTRVIIELTEGDTPIADAVAGMALFSGKPAGEHH
ncbi:MAG: NAD(P)H-binding protein [Nitrosomonas ureae]